MRQLSMDDYLKMVFLYIEESTLDANMRAQINGWTRARRYSALSSCTSLLRHEHQSETYRTLLQIEAFFKKLPEIGDETCRSVAAQVAFVRGERLCRITNKRIQHYSTHPDRLDRDLSVGVERMKSFIRRLCGEAKLCVEEIPDRIKVTSGATADRARARSLPFLKISGKAKGPMRAKALVSAVYKYYGANPPIYVPVEHNRVQLVPKNWRTHRTIACESTHVVPIQLAFDSYLKDRLRAHGINLRSQVLNQSLAREGAVTGEFATIDLEMASDTTALNSVALLFPDDWYALLSSLRSRLYVAPWGEGSYAKFSSMGNGLTFVLETIIFLAACKAVGSKRTAVYGDDIVIETELVPAVLKLLKFLGYHANAKKTHVNGPFRESCGANWHGATDVTPFYVRELPNNLARLSHLVNGMASIAVPEGKLWALLKGYVKSHRLPLVPFNGVSVSGVYVDVHTAYQAKVLRWKHGITTYHAYCAVGKQRKNRGWRSLFLWHLSAQLPQGTVRIGTFEESTFSDARVTSSMSLGNVTYRRKPRVYVPLLVPCPSWLASWSLWITS